MVFLKLMDTESQNPTILGQGASSIQAANPSGHAIGTIHLAPTSTHRFDKEYIPALDFFIFC